jgi:NAD(P)H-hydrate repair Nnr-like enzyme with NAD(P)H-hydrate dehydratase domain
MTRFTLADARPWIAVPQVHDDKYSRGVLGVVTGSRLYPGAAVLGVEAAARTGVGMIRYVGDTVPGAMVLQRRPETVTAPGRVQAWLLGSGMDALTRDPDDTVRLSAALADGVPAVVDAGALDLADGARGPLVITPHYRELARTLSGRGVDASAEQIAADPDRWALQAARITGATVLLKGHETRVATPAGELLTVAEAPAWLATAGSGDALAGILGALLATHAEAIAERGHEALARLAAAAAALHGAAGTGAVRFHDGGAITALDVAEAVPHVIGRLLASR